VSRTKSYPVLKDRVRLKRVQDYCIVYEPHPSRNEILHPSHAVMLSLCTGCLSLRAISYLFGETFSLSPEEASNTVAGALAKYERWLEFREDPLPTQRFRADPRRFIAKGDVSIVSKNAQPLPVPLGISLNLTFRCNFRCVYCYQALSESPDTLPFERWIELIEESAEWGVVYVGLTGGEPTLFPGWLRLIERIIALGMTPLLTTNGAVIGRSPEIAQHLARIGLRDATISLDASTRKLHQVITDSPESFVSVINAVRYLTAENIRVSVKYVLNQLNKHDVGEFIDSAIQLGAAEIGISYKEAGAVGSKANVLPGLSAADLADAREIVLAKRRAYEGKCQIHPPEDRTRLWDEKSWYPCGGPNLGMSVFPSGDVSFCDKLYGIDEFKIGNILEEGIKTIWSGDALASVRSRSVDKRRIDQDCVRCSELQVCRTGCFVESYQASGKYFAKHPNCGGPWQLGDCAEGNKGY
jgi:radical SAM protein with 4Fe4S-binding SPASM domain